MALRTVARAVLSAVALTAQAASTDLYGVVFPNQLQLAGSKLELHGAGVRWKFVVKVYAAGLYLVGAKADTVQAVPAAPGPGQLSLAMLRTVGSDQLSQPFMRGIGRNLKSSEALRLTQTLLQTTQELAEFRQFKAVDMLTVDNDPKQGANFRASGRQVHGTVAGSEVLNAAMQIWRGRDPADLQLKDALLGKQTATTTVPSIWPTQQQRGFRRASADFPTWSAQPMTLKPSID